MSKSIKVSEDVYQMLLAIQRPRETFSEEIARLLHMYGIFNTIEPLIRGQHDMYEERVRQKSAIGTDLSGKPLIKEPE